MGLLLYCPNQLAKQNVISILLLLAEAATTPVLQ
jgi:hypothetical protein